MPGHEVSPRKPWRSGPGLVMLASAGVALAVALLSMESLRAAAQAHHGAVDPPRPTAASGRALHGQSLLADDIFQGGGLLAFVTAQCPFSRQLVERVAEREVCGDPCAPIVFVVLGDPAGLRERLHSLDCRVRLDQDGHLAQACAIAGVPSVVSIEAGGGVAAAARGMPAAWKAIAASAGSCR